MYSTFAAMNMDSEQEFGTLNHVVYMRWPFSSQSSLSLLTGVALARGKGGPGDRWNDWLAKFLDQDFLSFKAGFHPESIAGYL